MISLSAIANFPIIQRKYREKTGNIFSKIEQMLKFLEWMLSEKKAASECTKNCTITLIFHDYFMVFHILEGIQQVGTKRRQQKKNKKSKKSLKIYICHF